MRPITRPIVQVTWAAESEYIRFLVLDSLFVVAGGNVDYLDEVEIVQLGEGGGEGRHKCQEPAPSPYPALSMVGIARPGGVNFTACGGRSTAQELHTSGTF